MAATIARRRRGVTTIEYGLLAAGVVLVCLLAVETTGSRLETVMTRVAQAFGASQAHPYPNGLPYQGLGLAPPSGSLTLGTYVSAYKNIQTPVYEYANGAIYSEVDPGNPDYTVYADGFTLSPAGQAPGTNVIDWTTFQQGCAAGGATGNDYIAGDYTTGGTASKAPNGDWVCSGIHPVTGGAYDWVYYDFLRTGGLAN